MSYKDGSIFICISQMRKCRVIECFAKARREDHGRRREDSLTAHCGHCLFSLSDCPSSSWHGIPPPSVGAALEHRRLAHCNDWPAVIHAIFHRVAVCRI